MRKIGIVCALLGAGLAVAMLFLRQTPWYADEAAHRMSEPVEWIISSFWAAVVLGLLGITLFSCSFRREKAPPPVIPEPTPVPEEPSEPAPARYCRVCGTLLSPDGVFCPTCGEAADDGGPSRQPWWKCPVCGQVLDDNASICTACGHQRFG